jgi:hypothetical protein
MLLSIARARRSLLQRDITRLRAVLSNALRRFQSPEREKGVGYVPTSFCWVHCWKLSIAGTRKGSWLLGARVSAWLDLALSIAGTRKGSWLPRYDPVQFENGEKRFQSPEREKRVGYTAIGSAVWISCSFQSPEREKRVGYWLSNRAKTAGFASFNRRNAKRELVTPLPARVPEKPDEVTRRERWRIKGLFSRWREMELTLLLPVKPCKRLCSGGEPPGLLLETAVCMRNICLFRYIPPRSLVVVLRIGNR